MKVFKNYGLNNKNLLKIKYNFKYFCINFKKEEVDIVSFEKSENKKNAITNSNKIINDLQIKDKNKQNPIDEISNVSVYLFIFRQYLIKYLKALKLKQIRIF